MAGLIPLAWNAVYGHRLRSMLSMLGIAVGVGSVVLLTSIGEGTRTYLIELFTQFGTNIIAVNPGKSETLGIPGVLGGTTHPLTLEDALALERLPEVLNAMPMAMGSAQVEGGGRGRSVFIYGTTPEIADVFQFKVRQGSFWPAGDPREGSSMAVLGPTLARELFGEESALGQFVRIAGGRFRVVGIMEPKGDMLGFDIGDAAYLPVATAMRLFNVDELMEIDIVFPPSYAVEEVEEAVRALLMERHGGRDDVSIMNQAAMLETFDTVMNIITLGVGAIAGISLLVGAVGILTMMWIAVGERTREIGLMRSIGATRKQVRFVFLAESAALSTVGGILGLGAALGLCFILRGAVPGLPVRTPISFALLAVGISLVTGILSGVLPAHRAASLDPIDALRAE